MTNTNCLAGIKCPECGYEDRFFICAPITADVTDDGSEIAKNRGDFEWDSDSRIECHDCGATGTVGRFSLTQQEEQPTMTVYTTYQLADDKATYGTDAGKIIVTSGDQEQEVSGPMARKDAKAFAAALNACRMVVSRWERGDLAEAARARSDAIALATVAGTPHSGLRPYSVLLLYPDDVNDDGSETFYAWVEATDSIAAVAVARREAVTAQEEGAEYYEPADFVPLLVTEGHHHGQPISND
jgi:hypothetical protein